MKRSLRSHLEVLVSAVLVIGLLASCGEPVCVAGIGDCRTMPLADGAQATGGSGQMTLVTKDRRQSVVAGGSTTLLAGGGKPPYTFSVQTSLDPKGTVKVQGDGKSAIYEAPDTSTLKRRQELRIHTHHAGVDPEEAVGIIGDLKLRYSLETALTLKITPEQKVFEDFGESLDHLLGPSVVTRVWGKATFVSRSGLRKELSLALSGTGFWYFSELEGVKADHFVPLLEPDGYRYGKEPF
jgi:hypothetical protein